MGKSLPSHGASAAVEPSTMHLAASRALTRLVTLVEGQILRIRPPKRHAV